MKKISINSVNFTLKRKVIRLKEVEEMDFKSLEECYFKCSTSKNSIFNYWQNVLKDVTTLDFYKNYYGIRSFNANMITLHALIMLENKLYYVDITKSHNYIYEVIAWRRVTYSMQFMKF